MRQFWDIALEPILRVLAPRRILEIGVDQGLTTKPLIEFAVAGDAFLDAIDPDPKIDTAEWQRERPDHVRFHLGLSLDVIPGLDPPDVALLDGDHNWYTVHSELVLLEQQAATAGRLSPLVLLHDVQWPYARRDLYYDAATIPKPHRHPHEHAGLAPDRSELLEGGGLNAHLDHAIFEGGERNGVLTAVEDFVAESAQTWKLTVVPGLHGLGILAPAARLDDNKPLRDTIAALGRAPALRRVVALVESERIDSEICRQDGAGRLRARDADAEQLAAVRRELEVARNALRERDERRQDPGELQDVLLRADRAEAQAQDAVRRLEIAKSERESERERRIHAERELVSVAREQAALEGRIGAQEAELASLRDEAEAARTEGRAARAEARAAREEAEEVAQARDRSERRRQALEQREEDLEGELVIQRRWMREAAEQHDELKRVAEVSQQRLAEAVALREKAEHRFADQATELELLIATRTRQAADAADARESMERALEDIRVEACEAQSALVAARERLEISEIEAEAREAQLTELQHALSRAHADAEQARALAIAADARAADARHEHADPRAAVLAEPPAPAPVADPGRSAPRAIEPIAPPPAPVEPDEPPADSPGPGSLRVDFNEHELAARDYFRREYDCDARALGGDPLVDSLALPAVWDHHGHVVAQHALDAPGPSVDVVVCVHDALADVRTCLWSVVHKTDRPYRLVIVNDGSDKDTTSYLEQVAADVPQIHLVHRDHPPHGYTIAANLGLRASTGDYVVLLNSDTIVTRGWLDRIVDCGESDPNIGILGPLSNAASHQSIPDLRDAAGWSTNPLPAFTTPDAIAKLLERVSPRERPRIPFVNGFCYVVKRSVIDAIGVFDEENFASGYCEENDFSYRAGQAGFELAVVDDGYVFHAKSKSFGVQTRKAIAKRNYEVFLDKHGRDRIQAAVRSLEQSTALAPLRATVRDTLSSPRSLVAALDSANHEALKVMFVLPGIGKGGSGGSHSIYQEVLGMRALGLDARIALRATSFERARAAYDDADEVFVSYRDDSELEHVTLQADVIAATHFKSALLVAGLQARRDNFLPAYYVQDYEPFFTSRDSADVKEAIESYTLMPGCLLFAKTHWLCNIVGRRHGVFVAKVEPSIDEHIFRPSGARRSGGPLRVTAMVRPRTPRRQPTATVAVLEQLSLERGAHVDVTTFGCSQADFERLTDHPPLLAGHRGLLRRKEVADLLAASDVFLDLSMYQAFGRTALEAMACGATAVVPRLGGVWEFLEHDVNGIAVDALAPQQALGALTALAGDRPRLEALQAAARQTGARYCIQRSALSEYLLFAHVHASRFGVSARA